MVHPADGEVRVSIGWDRGSAPRSGRRAGWTALGLALVGITGWADYATGYEASVALFYLVPIALVALRAGRGPGVLAACASALAWYVADRGLGHPYSVAWVPFWNAGVRLGIFTVVAVLLAELRGTLERERRQRESLEELNRLKGEFLGMAAHDLRTPIAVIQIYAEMALAEPGSPLSERQRRSIEVIRHRSEFMLKLVSDLLDMTRIEAGRLVLEPRQRDYGAFLLGKVALLEALAARRGLSLGVTVEEGLPALPFDGERVEQVLDNLVINAMKFSPPGGRISVEARRRGDSVETRVSDQGPGIPPAERASVFRAFHTGAPAPGGGEKGTGLGLAIAKRVVEAHGGNIALEDRPGAGTSVVFTLPVAAPARG